MKTLNIPEGYQYVMPYLIIKNAGAFFDFTQAVFNATEKIRHLREDGKMQHAELMIGDSTIMYTDATDQYPQQNAGLYVYVADCDMAYEKALQLNAESIMPPANQSYGRSAGIKDPFGNTWWITQSLD